jgi:hypothetical protein
LDELGAQLADPQQLLIGQADARLPALVSEEALDLAVNAGPGVNLTACR